MKKPILFLLFAIPLLCMAKNNLTRYYEYDDAGNRILRKTLILPSLSPPAPPDSLPQPEELLPPTAYRSPQTYTETLAQVEMKIYPNPTTENVTLEITNMENLSTGNFKLYSLPGQLLQEHPVHSSSTAISLAGLPTGTYILKVYINNRTEDWKIIKN
jgi:hypothetical protein